ncbi:MAG: 30S ribosomal protein S20 [Dehalococcoidales bacterium]|nr:MAG: 30S ribosomal protein S20 [Dehalococcoidales bacterium]
MPITKSAQKQVRVSERKRLRNQPIRSQCKTSITKAEKLIFAGKLDEAVVAVTEAVSTLDKAAEKGVIHSNNAARRKSRLLKKLNSAQKPQPSPPAPEPAEE